MGRYSKYRVVEGRYRNRTRYHVEVKRRFLFWTYWDNLEPVGLSEVKVYNSYTQAINRIEAEEHKPKFKYHHLNKTKRENNEINK